MAEEKKPSLLERAGQFLRNAGQDTLEHYKAGRALARGDKEAKAEADAAIAEAHKSLEDAHHRSRENIRNPKRPLAEKMAPQTGLLLAEVADMAKDAIAFSAGAAVGLAEEANEKIGELRKPQTPAQEKPNQIERYTAHR